MNEYSSDLPQAENADPDGVQVALRAAHTLWSRGDTTESLKWLRKAAESASDEGADVRSLQLAKAAAELRGKLFGSSEPPRPSSNEISGAHPIAQPHALAHQSLSEPEPARAASAVSPSSPPPALDAFGGAHPAEESVLSPSSRPVVTATQYPSHRPRQRMGLTSSTPGLARDGGSYTPVPSWSAESERRTSSAPPPLPRAASLDEYEELEAEPDEEPADDPGSVWTGGGSESWRPEAADASGDDASWRGDVTPPAPPSVLPPPLPLRGAFAEDDADFGQHPDAQTVMMPSPDESDGDPRSSRRQAASAYALAGGSWDPQQVRTASWDHDGGSSWAEELRNASWGGSVNLGASELEPGVAAEPPPPSETAPAKLTARVHHQAVRVSFAPDLRVPGQYVVRPLREGEKAATGERIALLVALEPGLPLV